MLSSLKVLKERKTEKQNYIKADINEEINTKRST